MKKLASAILRAAEIREESYNHHASDEAVKCSRCVDFSKFYRSDLHQAAEQAVVEIGLDLDMTQLIYLLLKIAWYDVLEWAESISKK